MTRAASSIVALAAALALAGCGQGAALRIEDETPIAARTGAGPAAAAPASAGALKSATGGTVVGRIDVPSVTAIGYWDGTLWMISRVAPGRSRLQALSLGQAEAHLEPSTGVLLDGEPTGPNGLAVGDEGVWAAWAGSNAAIHIDPESGSTIAVGYAPGPVERVLQWDGRIWALSWPAKQSSSAAGALTQLSPARPVEAGASAPMPAAATTLPVGPRPIGISPFAGALWVVDAMDGTVRRISADGRSVLDTTDVRISAASRPTQITAYRDKVWAFVGNGVVEVDTATGQRGIVRRIAGIRTGTFAAGTRALWVIGAPHEGAESTLIRLDPETGRQVGRRLPLDTPASEVITGGGAVWVVTPASVLRIVPTDEP